VDREAADVKRTESGDAALPALLGCEDALAQIAACFAGGARLVTLLGQGGMGKTLLARHALQRAVQQHGRTIRLPMEVAERNQQVDAATWELTHQLQRPPTDAELDNATNTSAGMREDLTQSARVVASLDQPAAADSTATLGDLVSTDQSNFEEDVTSELTLDLVRQAVDRLSDLQREVIRHRFGFDGADPASLQTTAERMGIGVRKVRQAEAEALEILSVSDVLEAAHEAA